MAISQAPFSSSTSCFMCLRCEQFLKSFYASASTHVSMCMYIYTYSFTCCMCIYTYTYTYCMCIYTDTHTCKDVGAFLHTSEPNKNLWKLKHCDWLLKKRLANQILWQTSNPTFFWQLKNQALSYWQAMFQAPIWKTSLLQWLCFKPLTQQICTSLSWAGWAGWAGCFASPTSQSPFATDPRLLHPTPPLFPSPIRLVAHTL